MKANVEDNFTDIAVRVTSLGSSNDSIKTCISDANAKSLHYKDEIISALSAVDKNIIEQLSLTLNSILAKVNSTCSEEMLQAEITKVAGIIQETLCNEKFIMKLQEENKQVVSKKQELEKKQGVLNSELKAKNNEVKNLNKEIKTLSAENSKLMSNNLSIISELELEKEKLRETYENEKAVNAGMAIAHKEEVKKLNEEKRKFEEKSVKMFNDEKKAVANLKSSIDTCNKKIAELEKEKVQLNKEIASKNRKEESLIAKLHSLEEKISEESVKQTDTVKKISATTASMKKYELQLKDYKTSMEEQKLKIEEYQEDISKLTQRVQNKDKDIEHLKATIEEIKKNQEIKVQKIKQENISNIFSNSRTSTTIKQEKIAAAAAAVKKVAKKTPPKKPSKKTGKVAKSKNYDDDNDFIDKKDIASKEKEPVEDKLKSRGRSKRKINDDPLAITQTKRKLISSSQSTSAKSTQQNSKLKNGYENKNILQDLDIFNEFEAIDRMGTIGKHGW